MPVRASVPLYTHIQDQSYPGVTIADAVEAARKTKSDGYTAIKTDPFKSQRASTGEYRGADMVERLSPQAIDEAMAWMTAVREAVGPDYELMVDAHGRFDTASAISAGRALEPIKLIWYEEPVPHSNIAAMVEVARESPIPVATGESFSSKQEFAELLKHEVVSIYQPEIRALGGLFATRKIADMVDAHFGVIAPHSAQGPVCSACCVQLNASIPNFFLHEIFDEFNEPWEKRIITNPVEVTGGYIEISDRPGLGVDLILDELPKHPYRQENYLPLFKPGWEKRETT